jgi:low affinity Fe/Cu permease
VKKNCPTKIATEATKQSHRAANIFLPSVLCQTLWSVDGLIMNMKLDYCCISLSTYKEQILGEKEKCSCKIHTLDYHQEEQYL